MVLTRYQRNRQNILESFSRTKPMIPSNLSDNKNCSDDLNYYYESFDLNKYNCIICSKKFQKHNNFRCKYCINTIIKDIINIFLIFNIILSFILCIFIFLFYYYEIK